MSYQNIVCIAMWSLVMHSNCLEWGISKEQMVIVHLYLILFILLYHYAIHGSYNICNAWFLDIRLSTYFNFALS